MPSSPEAEEAKPTATTPQVRTRITVVCAECKRLKLKCDRGVPCSSCKKRGTVVRCQYSEKAFQKLDLHSLNTRLSRVEAAIAQFTPTVSAILESRPLMLSISELSSTWIDTCALPSTAFVPPCPSPTQPSPIHLLPPLAHYFGHPPARPHVTPTLLNLLPTSRAVLARYLVEAEKTMRTRPSFGWARFRSRIETLMHPLDQSPPASIPLFAATCAALAIGALTANDSPEDIASFLDALSHQALSVAETNPSDQTDADMDYIIASILQVVYIFRSGQICPSNSSTAKKVMGMVGKMVNFARQMSLNIDPTELELALDRSEIEIRRRLWWQIVWFDTYVSNIMGHLPLTADSLFTTKIPHDGAGYFGLSCRLAHLVRKMAILVDSVKTASQLTVDGAGRTYTLDQASALELQVKQLLDDIPLALEGNVPEALHLDGPIKLTEAAIISQQCELAVTAQKLIIRLYLPFLSAPPPISATSTTTAWLPPYQASFATVNAAHAIVDACRKVYNVWQNDPTPRHCLPALFDLYPIGRTLFDAAVVCAHATINQPHTMWATVALEDVRIALAILSEPEGSLEKWPDIDYSDAIHILEALKDKAETIVGSGSPNALKRKSSVVDEPGTPGSSSGPRKSSTTTDRNNGDNCVDDKPKNPRRPLNAYPAVGIRIRPNTKFSGMIAASSSPKVARTRRRGSTSASESAHNQGRVQVPPAPSVTNSPNISGRMASNGANFRSRTSSSATQTSPILVSHHGSHQPPPLGIHPLDVIQDLPLADGNIVIDTNAPIRGKGYQPWLNACWDAYRQGLPQPEYVGSQFEQAANMYTNDEIYERSPNSVIPLGTFPFPQQEPSSSHSETPPTFTYPQSNNNMPSLATRADSHPYYHFPTQPSFEGLSPPGQQQQQQPIHNMSTSLVGLGLQGLGSGSTMDSVLSSSASAAPSLFDEELATPSDSVVTSSSSCQNIMQVGNGGGQQPSSHHGWVPSEEFEGAQNRNIALNGGHFWPNANPEFQYFGQ